MRNRIIVLTFIALVIGVFSCAENPSVETSTPAKVEIDTAAYLTQGKIYADSAQKMLGSNLVKALNANGTIGAIDFCSEKAIPITQEASESMNVKLSRVSDLPRNQDNMATAAELEIISKMKNELSDFNKIEPALTANDGYITAYFPILTQPLCTQCHGTKEKDIAVETQEVLAALYPLDKATGYGVNELRGIWKVVMETK